MTEMEENIYIGTSGYDYTDWRGTFYPADLPRDRFLEYYSENFRSLEINYTYYRIPEMKKMRSMKERSSGKLKFSLKGYQGFTHNITGGWKEDVKEFRTALRPLIDDELLLSVLLQFPQRFHYDIDARRFLDNLIHEFGNTIPLVAEFRHDSWIRESVFKGLADRDVGFCICDMPDLKNLPGPENILAGDSAYIRFHGRNRENWYGTNSRDRYEYLYDHSELEAYIPLIRELSGKARLVQIYMNNHAKGNAVINARKLALLLQASQ